MHPAAYEWVRRHATIEPVTVLDVGGRNINGTVRDLFPQAEYIALDIRNGGGVDIVADAATWTPDQAYDVVVCTEVFEHTPRWKAIVRTAHDALSRGGMFIATMAGPGRAPHSAVDGGPHLHPGEHYANIEPADFYETLAGAGFAEITVDWHGEDVRAVAKKPLEEPCL